MNILILTNSHPMNIVEIGNNLHKRINSINTEILGIQSMALMAENVQDVNYMYNIFILANALRKAPEVVKSTKTNTIFYGNIDRNTNIHFDHIYYYAGSYDQPDNYLAEAAVNMQKVSDIKVDWFKPQDAEYEFISLEHLYLMLKNIGVELNESDN